MVTTRSQDKTLEESALPVRPRAEEALSDSGLKRSRTPVEDDRTFKRVRTGHEPSFGAGSLVQSPAAPDVPDPAPTQPAAANTLSPIVTYEASHATDDGNSTPEQQDLHNVQSSAPERGTTDEPDLKSNSISHFAVSMQKATTRLASTNETIGAQPQPSDANLEGADMFMTPESSRRKDGDLRPTRSVSADAPETATDATAVSNGTDFEQVSVDARDPGRLQIQSSVVSNVPRRSKQEVNSLPLLAQPSSSIASYRKAILGRHRQTPFWRGRKPRFASISAG